MPRPGVYDLAGQGPAEDEQTFYQKEYRQKDWLEMRWSRQSLEAMWLRSDAPVNQIVRRWVGDIAGQRMLLLGNGSSPKELLFIAERPAAIVLSDLSFQAATNMKEAAAAAELRGNAIFAAIDATRLPFPPGSFDIVYGFAFAHHLPDLESFVRGVFDVLAPGGRAVFMDDGYVPLWQASKRTWLWPLMRLAHWRHGISKADYRATMTGGFKEADLARIITGVGGEPEFERSTLLTYFVYRASNKLLPSKVDQLLHRPAIARGLARIDQSLTRHAIFRKNQVRLVWGFRKPAGVPAPREPMESGAAAGIRK